MKKQKIVALALGTIIGIGSIFGGGVVHADEINSKETKNQCIEEVGGQCLEDEFFENGVLTKAELKQYNDAVDHIMKLYDDLEEQDLSDEVLNKLVAAENKIYEDNKVVFDKVDKYYDSLEDAPHNKEANEDGDEPSPEALMEDFYNELLENKVLSVDEVALLKEADAKIDALYDTDLENFDEDKLDEIERKENAIYDEYKQIYNKLDAYYEQVEEDMYAEMIESGDFTKEQVEKLKLADEKAEELFNTLSESSSDEEAEKVLNEIDKLYEELGF